MSFGAGGQDHASRLTRLYSDTKHSLQAALPSQSIHDLPEKQSLDRKYRIQKDRLIAWGLQWRDDYSDGNIDKGVEETGMTEVVESVLSNINGILDEIERMNSPAAANRSRYPVEKATASGRSHERTTSDLSRYEDLVRDMTTAIDVLVDVAKSNRPAEAPSKQDDMSKGNSSGKQHFTLHAAQRPASPVPAYSQSGLSSVDRSWTSAAFDHDEDSDSFDLTRIDPSLLVLPQEGPPTYGDSRTIMRGALSAPIVFGHIRQSGGTLLPVMVEYATFDRAYRDTGMILPLTRLERLHSALGSWNAHPPTSLTRPIAYFEDPVQPRYGLIYELPPAVRESQQQTPSQMYPDDAATLSKILHETSKPTRDLAGASPPPPAPPLEERFRLAQQLVHGFSFLKEHDFAHRNVSSSSVALFPRRDRSEAQPYDVRRPLICAVDLFSEYDMDPLPELLQQNIYRHPDDPRIKGPTASTYYEHRFDLYSLSLLLLEIGLWAPLAELYKEKYSLKDFKLRVAKIWIRKELTQKCGTQYSRCVQELFRAGDLRSSAHNPALLSRAFDRVRARLDKCCLIDLDEDDFDAEEDDTNETSEPIHARSGYESKQNLSKEKSVEQYIPQEAEKKSRMARNIYTDIPVPSHIYKEFQAFESRLMRILNCVLKDSRESSWVDIHYAGESKETAKPAICVGCTSTKRVRTAIRQHLEYNQDLFDLAVVKDSIRRSKSTEGVRRSQGDTDSTAMNSGHHLRPLCGSSIGAWRFSEHSPAVTFGGVVLVDGEPFGMTVHHLLEDPDAEAGQAESKTHVDPAPEQGDESDEEDEEDTDDDIASALNDLSVESFTEEDDGFTSGITRGQGDHVVLTQPALDDVDENFFPCDEDKDEDHIDSHRLGHVHASSGLRRSTDKDGISHEIDWLLMKLDDERLQPYNVVPGGRRYCLEESLFSFRPKLLEPICRREYDAREDLYPRKVVAVDQLSGLDVHCTGRTSGLGDGKISQRMRWVRFAGRTTFSQVWSATGSFGAGGDSGAWIFDNAHGRIAGHVLAYSDRFQMAYISPMDIILDDMRSTLGAIVALPGADEQMRPLSAGQVDLRGLTMEQLSKAHQSVVARHTLFSGNPAHLEREWNARRSRLGQAAMV